ncbi:hypothetical protein ABZ456_14860 [Streptomyces sp. NPDC005776]|uniref:hypothetical protein n=1 Tax=Streptomyces sp. NPDC005776 TaxID=3154676 RepID=UPI00340FCC79
MIRTRTRTVLTALFLTGVLIGGAPVAASAATPAAAVSRTASVQNAGHVEGIAAVHTGAREAAHTYKATSKSKSKSKSKKRRKHGSGGFGGGLILGIVLAVIVVGIIAFVLVARARRNS